MPCTPAVATHQLYTQARLRPLAAVAPKGGGVDQLACRDLDGDGDVDMAFSVASGGTAGDTSWVALLRVGAGWRVVHFSHGYKLGLVRVAHDLVETEPVYKPKDPNCCPSGGFVHIRWHWNGVRLVSMRHWHDTSPGG